MSASWITTMSPSIADDGGADGAALAAVRFPHQHGPVAPLTPFLDDVGSAVGRAVVDDDDLRVQTEALDALEHLQDRAGLVVGRHDEGHAHYSLTLVPGKRAKWRSGGSPTHCGRVRPPALVSPCDLIGCR
jgi:hypothetical protein